jgi:DNA-binding response OmpR family regulator
MLTARGFAIDDEKEVKLNIAEYLSKPFSPKELLVHVENVLSPLLLAKQERGR